MLRREDGNQQHRRYRELIHPGGGNPPTREPACLLGKDLITVLPTK